MLCAHQASHTQHGSFISTAPTKKHHIGNSTGNHQQAFGAGCPLPAVLHGVTRHVLGRMLIMARFFVLPLELGGRNSHPDQF